MSGEITADRFYEILDHHFKEEEKAEENESQKKWRRDAAGKGELFEKGEDK